MAGGKMNVGFAGNHWTPRIDAHPKMSGDFQHAITVGEKTVYLTKGGKEEFDRLAKQGFQAYVFKDVKGSYFNIPTPTEWHLGRP